MERLVEAETAMMDADGVGEVVGRIDANIAAMLGLDEEELERARRMAEKYPDDPDARAAYEERLLDRDRLLALRETKRREMAGAGKFGITDIAEGQYRVGLGYGQQVAGELEAARTERLKHEKWLAIGGVAGRLAITAGEPAERQSGALLPGTAEVTLPVSFNVLTTQIATIAEERAELLRVRLDNFTPTRPEADMQPDSRDTVMVGMEGETMTAWLAFHRKVAGLRIAIDNIELDAELEALLRARRYREVIEQGYGVITFPALEQIEPMDLVGEALRKYFS
ncbi:MAG TPA: hypothetical protein VLH84_00845 [Patescibacteria group bacterium]|nr:hypothetical protein [Patescibacteria group bacterium]